MKILLSALVCVYCFFTSPLVSAQESGAPKNVTEESPQVSDNEITVYFDKLRADFRKNKAALVGSQMNLSASELEVFWRIYAEYEQELIALNDQRIESINDYLENFDTMSAEKARTVLARYFFNQRARIDLREKYAGKFSRLLSPLVALRFTHVEAQIGLVIEAELAAQLPFAEAAQEVEQNQ